MSPLPTDPRVPKEHGSVGKTVEVVDLGGAVARITRTTYVGLESTHLVVMSPPSECVPMQSIDISLTGEELAHFVERLAWPK